MRAMNDWIEVFEKFLMNDLENTIKENMLIANSPPHVLLVQRPEYCDKNNEIAYTRGLVEIGGKQYIMTIIADYKLYLILIKSEAFEISVGYNFYAQKVEDISTGISKSHIREPTCL